MRREIYLDANASHPLLPSVKERWRAALAQDGEWGNASSTHAAGRRAKNALTRLKDRLRNAFDPAEAGSWTLLSGATEAINLALRGWEANARAHGRSTRYLSTAVEHAAVLETIRGLGEQPPTLLPVDAQGRLNLPQALDTAQSLKGGDAALLIALQAGNNETGALFDLDTLLPQLKQQVPEAVVFLDLAQALGKVPEARIAAWLQHADLAAFSAHKFGGPVGVGSLWRRKNVQLAPQLTGGGQEQGQRSGTTPLWGVLGFEAALEDWQLHGEVYRAGMMEAGRALREAIRGLPALTLREFPHALPNTLSLHVTGLRADVLLPLLDLEGYCVSSGSACASGTVQASHVLLAMGETRDAALSTLRVSWSAGTPPDDLVAFAATLKRVLIQRGLV
jgi:cysteine desulfurase